MVAGDVSSSYKPLRAGGDPSGIAPFGPIPHWESHYDTRRQYHCSLLSEKSGGDQILPPLSEGQGHSVVVSRPEDFPVDSIRTRETERACGPAKPVTPTASNRVDDLPLGSEQGLGQMAKAPGRPIRHKIHKSLDCVCLTSRGSPGSGDRCLRHPVEGATGLRLSPDVSNPSSTSQVLKRGTHTDFGHALLANERVVPRTTIPLLRKPSSASTDRGSAGPTPFGPAPPKPRDTAVNRMDVMRSGMRTQGIKSSVIEIALAAKRSSTDRLYDYRWIIWARFASKEKFDPLHPSLGNLTHFLESLHSRQGLRSGTLAGYRSAIAYTIAAATGSYPSFFIEAPVIQNLLAGIRNLSAAKQVVRFPAWDVFLVLNFLRSDLFEPLNSISLSLLTYKTVFLVALATARRVSGLHALSGLDSDISFSRDISDRSVTLSFLPDFLAKNQKAGSPSPSVRLEALSNLLAPDDPDIALCPVRALKAYRRRTSPFRKSKRRLFVSLNPNYDKDIAVATISRWLTTTVKMAYAKAKAPISNVIKAHELRAISASLALVRGVPLERILEAAYWRAESTFTSFYLRQYSTLRADNTFGIKRVVVAGSSAL